MKNNWTQTIQLIRKIRKDLTLFFHVCCQWLKLFEFFDSCQWMRNDKTSLDILVNNNFFEIKKYHSKKIYNTNSKIIYKLWSHAIFLVPENSCGLWKNTAILQAAQKARYLQRPNFGENKMQEGIHRKKLISKVYSIKFII